MHSNWKKFYYPRWVLGVKWGIPSMLATMPPTWVRFSAYRFFRLDSMRSKRRDGYTSAIKMLNVKASERFSLPMNKLNFLRNFSLRNTERPKVSAVGPEQQKLWCPEPGIEPSVLLCRISAYTTRPSHQLIIRCLDTAFKLRSQPLRTYVPEEWCGHRGCSNLNILRVQASLPTPVPLLTLFLRCFPSIFFLLILGPFSYFTSHPATYIVRAGISVMATKKSAHHELMLGPGCCATTVRRLSCLLPVRWYFFFYFNFEILLIFDNFLSLFTLILESIFFLLF